MNYLMAQHEMECDIHVHDQLSHTFIINLHTHILWFGVWMSSIIDLPCSVMCIWSKDGLKGRRRDYTYEATEAGIKQLYQAKH